MKVDAQLFHVEYKGDSKSCWPDIKMAQVWLNDDDLLEVSDAFSYLFVAIEGSK